MRILLSIFCLSFLASFSQTPRMCLYEEFTGETCGPCASTNPALNALLLSPVNATRVIPLKWQVPIPFAPTATWSLYQTNKTEIDWRAGSLMNGYGYPSQFNPSAGITSGINSAPQGRIDGQHQWDFGAASDHPANLNNNVITTAQSYTSAFSINMVHEWNALQTAVVVTVNIAASANFTSTGPLVFRCVMVERVIQFSVAPGSNGEKLFEDVVIRSYPSIQNGTSMLGNWTLGQTQTFVLTCPVPSYIRKIEEISMVGFIQDDGNKKVAQAARSKVLNDAVAVASKVEPTCGSNIVPIITISNAGQNAITNLTITPYLNGASSAPSIWTGNIATGNTGTIALDPLSTPSGIGAHTFSYNITSMNGIDFILANNHKSVDFPGFLGGAVAPVTEGFTVAAFPPADWTSVNTDAEIGWERTTQAGAYWQAPMNAAKYSFYNNSKIGDVDELYLPPMELRGGDVVQMAFDYAYAQKNTTSNDRLQVMVSDDCGGNWTVVFDEAGAVLATALLPVSGQEFVPNDIEFTQWKTVQLLLPGFNKGGVLVKFVATNDNGNSLYLDNINVVQSEPSNIQKHLLEPLASFDIFPNPAHDAVSVHLNNAAARDRKLRLVNILGQTVYETQLQKNTTDTSLNLGVYPAGVYYVMIESASGSTNKKLTVIK